MPYKSLWFLDICNQTLSPFYFLKEHDLHFISKIYSFCKYAPCTKCTVKYKYIASS